MINYVHMVIGFDTRPLSNLSASRGIGVYTKHLVDYLAREEGVKIIPLNRGDTPKEVELLHYPYFDLYFPTLPLWQKKPTVVTIHDLTPLILENLYPVGIRGKLTFKRQKLALRNIKAILTDSAASRRDIIDLLKISAEKVFYIPLAPQDGLTVPGNEKQVEIVDKYKLPNEYILFVGDINRNKNIPTLVKVSERLGIDLVIVGKQAAGKGENPEHIENQDLVELQSKAEKNPHIHLLGFVPTEDLGTIYHHALCLVMPSLYEGFGVPVIEAMQCGCAVVCSKQGSLPEVGGDVAIYSGTDEQSVAKAVTFVAGLSDGEKLMLLQAGIKQAKKFSWEITAQKTAQVYRQVLGK